MFFRFSLNIALTAVTVSLHRHPCLNVLPVTYAHCFIITKHHKCQSLLLKHFIKKSAMIADF